MGEEVQRLLSEGVKLNDITILVRKTRTYRPLRITSTKSCTCPLYRTKRSAWMPVCHLHADRCPALPVQSGRKDSKSLVNHELQFADYHEGGTETSPCSACRLAQTADRRCKDSASRRVRRPYGRILRLMPLYELLEELFTLFDMGRIGKQDAYLFFLRCGDRVPTKQLFRPRRFHPLLGRDALQQNHFSGEMDGIRIFSIHKSKGTGVPYRAHPLLRLETGERNIQPTGVVHCPRSAVQP